MVSRFLRVCVTSWMGIYLLSVVRGFGKCITGNFFLSGSAKLVFFEEEWGLWLPRASGMLPVCFRNRRDAETRRGQRDSREGAKARRGRRESNCLEPSFLHRLFCALAPWRDSFGFA